MQSLGSRMRAWRESGGFSQSEVARGIGVLPSAVSYWESDRNPPSVRNLERFVLFLGITMRGFYGPVRRRAREASQ